MMPTKSNLKVFFFSFDFMIKEEHPTITPLNIYLKRSQSNRLDQHTTPSLFTDLGPLQTKVPLIVRVMRLLLGFSFYYVLTFHS